MSYIENHYLKKKTYTYLKISGASGATIILILKTILKPLIMNYSNSY